jgi:hypothetical protein
MKLGQVKNPISGGNISLKPGNLIGMVLGAALLFVIWGFGKNLGNVAASKLPGNLSNFGKPAQVDPYGGIRVHA